MGLDVGEGYDARTLPADPRLLLVLLDGMANTSRYRPGFPPQVTVLRRPGRAHRHRRTLGLNLYAQSSGAAWDTPETLQSASVLALSVLGVWILAVVSRPFDTKKLALLLACVRFY